MIDTYYKYTGLLPLNYFENPNIKISVPIHLNDPFESNICENVYNSIENHLRKMSSSQEIINRGTKSCKKAIDQILEFNGVISFSETPRNSLMWAHYADQHHGMCIGFKKDTLKHITDDGLEDDFHILINEPRKVNYDNLRFDNEYEYNLSYNQLSIHAVKELLMRKSDEWIYEKEHRCIIPLFKADKLLITKEDATIDNRLNADKNFTENTIGKPFKKIIDKGLEFSDILKTESNNLYKINFGEQTTLCTIYQWSKNAAFLIDVDPESIQSIYFGCKVNNKTIKPYYDALKDRYKMYKFHLSKKRFELIPILITSEMFD